MNEIFEERGFRVEIRANPISNGAVETHYQVEPVTEEAKASLGAARFWSGGQITPLAGTPFNERDGLEHARRAAQALIDHALGRKG